MTKSIIKMTSTRGNIQISVEDELTAHEARELCDAVAQTINAQYDAPKMTIQEKEDIDLKRRPPMDLDQVTISVIDEDPGNLASDDAVPDAERPDAEEEY